MYLSSDEAIARAIELVTANPALRTAADDPESEAKVSDAVRAEIYSQVQPANWDGEGAPAITADACHEAVTFFADARSLNPGLSDPLFINAAVSGGIALYWESNGCQVLVEVGSVRASMLYRQSVGPQGQLAEGFAPRDTVLKSLQGL